MKTREWGKCLMIVRCLGSVADMAEKRGSAGTGAQDKGSARTREGSGGQAGAGGGYLLPGAVRYKGLLP